MRKEKESKQAAEQMHPCHGNGVADAIVADDFSLPQGTPQDESLSDEVAATYEANYAALLPLLQQLDQRLAAAVSAAEQVFAARAAGDLYRGLAITPADVAAALGRIPGEPLLAISSQVPIISSAIPSLTLQRLLWLQRAYFLTDFDLDVILTGLAPEIDLRYERLYAYLHDDVTRRRPSIDLALNILCANAADKLRQRERFASDAPLLRHRLIDVFADPHHLNPPLLARFYRLDEQVVRFLLLDDSMDSRLSEFCTMVAGIQEGEGAPLTEEMQQKLKAFAITQPRSGIRLSFQGPQHCGQTEAVALLAEALGLRILKADLRTISMEHTALSKEVSHALVREAWFRGAILYIRGVDSTGESAPANRLDALWQALKIMPVDCIIESETGWVPAQHKPLGVVTVLFFYPNAEQRKQWWQHCLRQQQFVLEEERVTELASRYRMTYAQIQDAAAVGAIAASASPFAADFSTEIKADDKAAAVFAAARSQCGHDLATLTTKIETRATWEELVLPEDQTMQLHEICQRFNHRDQVFNQWGFARKLSYGRGTTALFSGGSGTGKTMAAEVIANALGLDLYRIDLAQVVSKYIGETEKNLDKIFNAAENANAILFFDEADALFGKRSEVKDAHDRYANLEISYLLQKMEQYEGIAILATNLSDNLDQAFTRRLAFIIYFPFPDEAARLRIWERAWPQGVPMSESVDKELLAHEVKMAGGNIKNISLGAAFHAAGNGGIVDMVHLAEAVRREYQKLGRSSPVLPHFFHCG